MCMPAAPACSPAEAENAAGRLQCRSALAPIRQLPTCTEAVPAWRGEAEAPTTKQNNRHNLRHQHTHRWHFLYTAIPCALRDAATWPSAVQRTTATHCLHCKASCAQAQKHTPAQPHPSSLQGSGFFWVGQASEWLELTYTACDAHPALNHGGLAQQQLTDRQHHCKGAHGNDDNSTHTSCKCIAKRGCHAEVLAERSFTRPSPARACLGAGRVCCRS